MSEDTPQAACFGLTKRELIAVVAMVVLAPLHKDTFSEEPLKDVIADEAVDLADALLRKLDRPAISPGAGGRIGESQQ